MLRRGGAEWREESGEDSGRDGLPFPASSTRTEDPRHSGAAVQVVEVELMTHQSAGAAGSRCLCAACARAGRRDCCAGAATPSPGGPRATGHHSIRCLRTTETLFKHPRVPRTARAPPEHHVAPDASAARRAARLEFQRAGCPVADAARPRSRRGRGKEPPAQRTLPAHHWSAPPSYRARCSNSTPNHADADFHPDPHYKTYSSTKETAACHRKHGPAGYYGAETSACDSPVSLVNATLDWIKHNVADDIDFVVWTGDSARHDNDEKHPRTQNEIIAQNELLVEKLTDVFGNGEDREDPTKEFKIPIVPTFGNNDIMPHNILLAGPNKWTMKYLDIWRGFIPEAQRHQFQQGGWFSVEVVPGKLAVISLNTLWVQFGCVEEASLTGLGTSLPPTLASTAARRRRSLATSSLSGCASSSRSCGTAACLPS